MRSGREPDNRRGAFQHWRGLSWPSRIVAVPIYIYRMALSPLLPRNCRFEPSCSTYALEALQAHGPIRGILLTLRRISRCHPVKWLGAGEGYDPVPPARARSTARPCGRQDRTGRQAVDPAEDSAEDPAEGLAEGLADDQSGETRS